jgi:exportin-7
MLKSILEILIVEDNNYIWMLSKPLLGLIILQEQNFSEMLEYVVQAEIKNYEEQRAIVQAFGELMNGINRNYENKNKDRFAQNFGLLRKHLQTNRI